MFASGHNGRRCKLQSASAAVAFAASAGSLTPMMDVLAGLSQRCPAAILIAMHTGPHSILTTVLAPRTRLVVKEAEDGEPAQAGTVYVAPSFKHVVVNPDRTLSVLERERVRYVRPSCDWLFHSLAAAYSDTAIAVVFSGYRDDGARGARSVHRAGGRIIVQEPESCKVPEMPSATLRMTRVTSVFPAELIAGAITDHLARLDLKREQLRFDNPFRN